MLAGTRDSLLIGVAVVIVLASSVTSHLLHNLRMHLDMQIQGLSLDSEYVELAVEVFAMLADATRVRIVLALRDADELSVNRLAELVGKSPAAVSQHLAKLRLARMVSTRREGTTVFYRLTDEHASELVVDAVRQAEHAVGAVHSGIAPGNGNEDGA